MTRKAAYLKACLESIQVGQTKVKPLYTHPALAQEERLVLHKEPDRLLLKGRRVMYTSLLKICQMYTWEGKPERVQRRLLPKEAFSESRMHGYKKGVGPWVQKIKDLENRVARLEHVIEFLSPLVSKELQAERKEPANGSNEG